MLNAKQHEREARDHQGRGPARAPSRSRRTWPAAASTSSSARACVELGGLYVLGTERHEARRIDNQLRGRSGRQGDPGETRFYLSGQDDLVRLFAGDRIYNIMDRFKLPDDQPMEAKILSNQIEGAQKKVEEQNFVSRKNVLKYDDVMNKQRMVIYEQRRRVLEGEDLSEEVREWIDEVGRAIVAAVHGRASTREEWDLDGLFTAMQSLYGTDITADELREEVDARPRGADRGVRRRRARAYDEKEEALGPGALLREVERYIILQVVDLRWREHLEAMDYLREGIHLRAMAQKDPLVEYRGEGHVMFEELGRRSARRSSFTLFHVELERRTEPALEPVQRRGDGRASYEHESLAGADAIAAAGAAAAAAARCRRPLGGTDAVAPRSAGRHRAREDRPQRPLLVRLRQEVQEVPRR